MNGLRMLARLLPLALLLAACSRAPDYSGCRLVGTWEMDRKVSKALTNHLGALGGDSAQFVSIVAGLSEGGPVPTYVFQANGQGLQPFTLPSGVLGVEVEWQLIGEGPNEATVTMTTAEFRAGVKQTTRETFVFETLDRMFPASSQTYRYTRVSAK